MIVLTIGPATVHQQAGLPATASSQMPHHTVVVPK